MLAWASRFNLAPLEVMAPRGHGPAWWPWSAAQRLADMPWQASRVPPALLEPPRPKVPSPRESRPPQRRHNHHQRQPDIGMIRLFGKRSCHGHPGDLPQQHPHPARPRSAELHRGSTSRTTAATTRRQHGRNHRRWPAQLATSVSRHQRCSDGNLAVSSSGGSALPATMTPLVFAEVFAPKKNESIREFDDDWACR